MEIVARSPAGLSFGFTGRGDGDALDYSNLANAVTRLTGREWSAPVARLKQIHSDAVETVSPETAATAGPGFLLLGQGDAITSSSGGPAAAVFVADCAAIALYDRVMGLGAVVHAGWRGMAAGIALRAVERLRSAGCEALEAVVAPHAGPCCYEFGAVHATELERSLGLEIVSRTTSGEVSIDIFAALSAQLLGAGVDLGAGRPECTICSGKYFSYRAGDAVARQALVLLPSRP
ncbi:MAG: polyphenol oxidase family protein [Actinomycetota bacterium]|jgi:YfiH family protein|nr:polyphenol oxidase family protein [Actinomycetota bacterium]